MEQGEPVKAFLLLKYTTERSSGTKKGVAWTGNTIIIHRNSNCGDMAEVEDKYSDNVDGAFYVDDQCIDCDLCRETASDNFTRNEDGGYSYVYKQPENDDEKALCEEAMEGCPVEAIGENGAD